jgi:sugar/nucleoside kinase (ribokinase family)
MSTRKKRRRGILAGGNWIIDQVKMIDVFPRQESLANISTQSQGTGGSAYNILMDLAKMEAPFPLQAAGLVGNDALGTFILSDCKDHNIQTRHLKTTKLADTSYTDVMTEVKTGRRTFFHYRGTNALWDGLGLNFEKLTSKIFHLGYLLLLDAMDAPDKQYGTRAAKILATAQKAGLKTSVDVVSEDSQRFAKIVKPALKHTDYCILNEFEAGRTTGFKIRTEEGTLDTVALKHASGALLQCGIRELVVIHFPEGAFARTLDGQDFWQSSLRLPQKYIVGSAGAGDAFCAGLLYGLHEGWDIQHSLRVGVCAAAASLSHPTCTGGVPSLETMLNLCKKYKFRANLLNRE